MYNDYTDIEHKVRKETRKHEFSASIVIPFHEGFDILARTVASLTQQSYSRDLFEVVLVADANHARAA